MLIKYFSCLNNSVNTAIYVSAWLTQFLSQLISSAEARLASGCCSVNTDVHVYTEARLAPVDTAVHVYTN